MSICSNGSDMSVSMCGSEMPLSQALDEVFHGLQNNLSGAHACVRELAMMADRNEDYETNLRKVLEITDNIDEMNDLFKELKSVCSQVIGKPPAEEKVAMKKLIDDHKMKRKKVKDDLKIATDLAKSMADTTMS